MLIQFTLENWRSFKDPAHFTMIATRERQHGERVVKLPKYQTRVLPIASIYGSNASGKTNFFKAIHFARDLIVNGTQADDLIAVDPFRLDPSYKKKPARFAFEILIDDTLYAYSFALTAQTIIEEQLVQVNSSSEKILFHRKEGRPHFHATLEKSQFLNFAFQGTRENQLFLTNTVSQKVNDFRPIYDWFKNQLVLIAPDSRFGQMERCFKQGHPLNQTINTQLADLDTGIDHLGRENIPMESTQLPEFLVSKLKQKLKPGQSARLIGAFDQDHFLITNEDGELVAQKLVTFHKTTDGSLTKFEIHQESDGTQRIIHLLPAFLEMTAPSQDKVFVIDELDRSLHTMLTRNLIESYLGHCNEETRSQLIFTTHDLLVMDQGLLRRDEMWLAEREALGSSRLFPLSDYKDVRYDKNIRKSYLEGRMGGIPKLFLTQPHITD